jgi:hypothetical protein
VNDYSWFTMTGIAGSSVATISWTQADGFDDPTGRTDTLISDGTTVCATPDGGSPCYIADATRPLAAFLTALAAFDTIEGVENAAAFQLGLRFVR